MPVSMLLLQSPQDILLNQAMRDLFLHSCREHRCDEAALYLIAVLEVQVREREGGVKRTDMHVSLYADIDES